MLWSQDTRVITVMGHCPNFAQNLQNLTEKVKRNNPEKGTRNVKKNPLIFRELQKLSINPPYTRPPQSTIPPPSIQTDHTYLNRPQLKCRTRATGSSLVLYSFFFISGPIVLIKILYEHAFGWTNIWIVRGESRNNFLFPLHPPKSYVWVNIQSTKVIKTSIPWEYIYVVYGIKYTHNTPSKNKIIKTSVLFTCVADGGPNNKYTGAKQILVIRNRTRIKSLAKAGRQAGNINRRENKIIMFLFPLLRFWPGPPRRGECGA